MEGQGQRSRLEVCALLNALLVFLLWASKVKVTRSSKSLSAVTSYMCVTECNNDLKSGKIISL